GNSGFEDERLAAYLCFGTLHAPRCATQVFVCLAAKLPRRYRSLTRIKKPDSIGLFGNENTQNPRPALPVEPYNQLDYNPHDLSLQGGNMAGTRKVIDCR